MDLNNNHHVSITVKQKMLYVQQMAQLLMIGPNQHKIEKRLAQTNVDRMGLFWVLEKRKRTLVKPSVKDG